MFVKICGLTSEADAVGEFRVLWLGDPAVLPVGAWALPEDVAAGAYATTEGTPTARHVRRLRGVPPAVHYRIALS